MTGVSTDNIALTADFNGSELFVFGAVRRQGPAPEGAGPLDVIITVKGPARAVTVRRKERRFGIWVNTDAVVVRQAPSFYAVATTRPLDELLSQTELLRYQIGMDQAVRRVGGSLLEDITPFTEALVRLKEGDGAYQQLDDEVSIAEETLFQTRIEMPANLVEGAYAAEFFLVRDHAVREHPHHDDHRREDRHRALALQPFAQRAAALRPDVGAAGACRRLDRRRGLPPRPALSRQAVGSSTSGAASRGRSATPSAAVGRASA